MRNYPAPPAEASWLVVACNGLIVMYYFTDIRASEPEETCVKHGKEALTVWLLRSKNAAFAQR